MDSAMQFALSRLRWTLAGIFLAGCPVCVWLLIRWQVSPLVWAAPLPAGTEISLDGSAAVRQVGGVLATRIATFHDEMFAYLMYQHYLESPLFQSSSLVLYYTGEGSNSEYRIDLVLSNDFISSIDRVAALNAGGTIEGFQWILVANRTLKYRRSQTELFVAAYNLPVRRKMEDLRGRELRNLLRRFIRFKSTTDPRVRKRIEPVPKILGANDAQRVAGDIVDVARFFDLPLDLFLGIGAMENNYMDVRGDLRNSIWKRKAASDDIILQRGKGRVRVLNDSAGRWQITRETLRYVHQLYLQDHRDYSRLPLRLVPPKKLDINNVDSDVLTTYAGLLLRVLLDYFHGDTALAVGAYNGGAGNPNLQYESGVRSAAEHARSILERAAALNGESVMHMRWLSPR